MKTSIHLIRTLFLLFLCLSAVVESKAFSSASAINYDFESDEIYYRFSSDKSSVLVTYRVAYYPQPMYKLSASYSGDVIIPESVTYNDVTYPVTGIDWYAFNNCTGMTSVSIPSSVTQIGERAFSGCTSLKTIDLPNSISRIDREAFLASGLESFTIPEKITSIPEEMFNACKSLKTVIFHDKVVSIGNSSSSAGVFEDCTSLDNIILPQGLTSIENNTFKGCKALSNISIPNTVTSIGVNAFYQCTALKDVTIPASVKRINDRAFAYSGLTSVSLQCDLAEMENGVFLNIGTGIFCSTGVYKSELKLYLEDFYSGLALCLNKNFNSSYQSSSGWRAYRFYVDGEEVADFSIPEGVTTIPEHCFNGLRGVKNVGMPSTLKTIQQYAFAYCSDLESISLANSNDLTAIDTYAFRECTSLSEVTFGKGLKSIAEGAFDNCTNISKVDIGDLANWCSVDFDPTNAMSHRTESSWNNNTANPLKYAKKIHLNGIEVNTLRIPTGVKKISGWAFLGCARFDKVTIPSSVESIGMYAFCDCVDLAEISFSKNSKLDSIAIGAFYGCKGLPEVTLPSSLRKMGKRCFYQCSNLQAFSLPNKVKEIEAYTFYECTKLSNVILSEGLTSIGGSAFYQCSALERIEIPSSVNFIGTLAFKNCSSLTGVYIKDLVAWCKIGMPTGEAGGGWAVTYNDNNPLIYAHNLYLNDELVTDLVIPQGVESVGAWTFAGATCLKSVTFPEGCKKVGGAAFRNCDNLEIIRIPASMETFEMANVDYTNVPPFSASLKSNGKLYIEDLNKWISDLGDKFRIYNKKYLWDLYVNGELVRDMVVPENVTKLTAPFYGFRFTSVTLPSGLETIQSNTFSGCNSIKFIYSRSRFAPIGTDGLLTGYGESSSSNLQAIYVPKGRASNYKTSWTKNASIIQEVSDELLNGSQTAESISASVHAYSAVYGLSAVCVNLVNSTFDETVTEDLFQEFTDQGSIIFLPDGTEGIEGVNIVANGRTPKLILKDGADFSAPYDFTANELEYQRTFVASGTETTTLCLPFSLATFPAGMKAYSLQGQDTDGNAVFEEVETIEANLPYLVRTTIKVEDLHAVNVQVKATPTTMPNAGCDEFEFYGTLSEISHEDAADEESFVLGAGMQWMSVYDADEDVTVPAGRAYLIPADVVSPTFGTVLKTTTPVECVSGDTNGDGKISITDAVAIVSHILGEDIDGFIADVADVNEDGKITITDAVAIVDMILNGTALANERVDVEENTLDPQ